MNEAIPSVFDQPKDAKLTVEQLAEALYEGSPHVEYLMHRLARHYVGNVILPPYHAQNEITKDFFRQTASYITRFAIQGKYIKEEIRNAK